MAKKEQKDGSAKVARSIIKAKHEGANTILSRMLIPEDEKDIEWGMTTFFQIADMINRDGEELLSRQNVYQEMHDRYNMMIGDRYDYMSTVEQQELPVPFKFFPLIRNKVDQVVGEYTMRPEKRYAQAVDDESTNARMAEKLELEFRQLMAPIDKEIEEAVGFNVAPDNEAVPVVDNVGRYMKENPFDLDAELVNDSIEYLIRVRKLPEKIKPLLTDYLLSQHCVCEIVEDGGDPMPYRFAPDEYAYSIPTSEDFMDRCNWFFAQRYETLGYVIDRFRQDIEPEDIAELEKLANQNYAQTFFKNHNISNYERYLKYENNQCYVLVSRAYWQSYKIQKAKETKNKKGRMFFKMVGPEYKPRSSEDIHERLFDDPYQIFNVGGVFWFKFGKTLNQARSVDDLSRAPLPIVGLAGNNSTGFSASFAQLLEPVEDLYNEIMYQIRYLIHQSGGKALIYDVSQMPKQFGGNYGRVVKELKVNQIIPVDLSQEGNPESSSFNQWKELDFSLTNQISALWNAKMQVEKLADDISGVNDERAGNIGQYSTNDIAQENIRRSSMRTEVWLAPFDSFYVRLLERLVAYAKHIWPEGKKLQYWKGDGMERIFTITQSMVMKDFAFYLDNPYKQQKEQDTLEQLSMQLMSSASAEDPRLLLNYVRLLKADNYQEAERVFEQGIEAIEAVKQQQMEQQQQQQQAINESNEKIAQANTAAKEKAEANKIKIAEMNNRAKERIALILADEADVKIGADLLKDDLQKENDNSNTGTGNSGGADGGTKASKDATTQKAVNSAKRSLL